MLFRDPVFHFFLMLIDLCWMGAWISIWYGY